MNRAGYGVLALAALAGGAQAKVLGVGKDKADAIIVDSKGLPIGRATVVESKKHGLRVTVTAKGLTRGEHAVHLHTIGACEGPKFTSAGLHWNPFNKAHGTSNPDGSHAGDLPNILIGRGGRGKLSFDIPDGQFDKVGGLMDADGSAIVLHAQSDDNRTDPSGNSGDRIACGVFREK